MGVGFVQAAVGSLSLFGSTEHSDSYDHERVDEKHYFLIPDRRSENDYALYVMRCLPEGVPPINDLPKRRLFHLPNQHAMPTVENLLLDDARECAQAAPPQEGHLGGRLNDLADQIDRLDSKIFHGALLIGGLVALLNPLAGAAVAAKALVPSIGLTLSKFGLKYVGDVANARGLASRIKSAEADVLRQFRQAGTQAIENPILCQWDRALRTSEFEYEPILEFDSESMDFGERDRGRMLKLTSQAITNTYEEVLNDTDAWSAAHLGPEDVRYLRLLRDLAKEDSG